MKWLSTILCLCVFSSLFGQYECAEYTEDYERTGCNSQVKKTSPSPFIIYPNPTTGELLVKTDTDVDIQIFDVQGRLLMAKRGKGIDVYDLAQGIYIAVINGKFVGKFIKI